MDLGMAMFIIGFCLALMGTYLILTKDSTSISKLSEIASKEFRKVRDLETEINKSSAIMSSWTESQKGLANKCEINKNALDQFYKEMEKINKQVELEILLLKQAVKRKPVNNKSTVEVVLFEGGKKKPEAPPIINTIKSQLRELSQ